MPKRAYPNNITFSVPQNGKTLDIQSL
jgi:hypothetical protein